MKMRSNKVIKSKQALELHMGFSVFIKRHQLHLPFLIVHARVT